MEPTIYKPGAYKTSGIYKGAGGIYNGRGVYNYGGDDKFKGVFYYTDFKNFSELTKTDYPKIGDETSYSGLTNTNITKVSDNNINWLNFKLVSSFVKNGDVGPIIDTSEFDLFAVEMFFRLNNENNLNDGNFYLWFERFNRGYAYDPYHNYSGTDQGNGFCCNSNHARNELFNNVSYFSGSPVFTNFNRNINRQIVNFSVVYDSISGFKYSYLDGNLCVKDQYSKVNLFNLYPQNNTYGISCRLTNILLTNEDKRSEDKMNYSYSTLTQ